MPREIQPPKVTGGGGFVFEDEIVAYFLACMLADQPVLNAQYGTCERIDFQTRADGWHLDDVLLRLIRENDTRRLALSIKSNRQISRSGLPADFVSAAWDTVVESRIAFDIDWDFVGLVTTPLGTPVREELDELLGWARVQDTATLAGHIDQYGTPLKKAMRDSAVPPRGARAAGRAAAELLHCFQHRQFDFEATTSNDRNLGISFCRSALQSNDAQEAANLWDALCRVAAEYRPKNGFLTLPHLLALLRTRFRFKAYPRFERDWTRLSQFTDDALAGIATKIGGKVSLPREAALASLRADNERFTALIGQSGCGKTVLAKTLLEVETDAVGLWFNADSFDVANFAAFEHDLALAHPLKDVLDSVTAARAWIVIDGLDRQFKKRVFENVANLLRRLSLDREILTWRVVLTTQPESWDNVLRQLAATNFSVNWKSIPVDHPEDFTAVWSEFPKLEPLSRRPELKAILLRPAFLDLLASHMSELDAGKWVGESDLIEWVWKSVIRRPPDASMRATFVSNLATKQGDEMRNEIPVGEFAVADQAPLGGLVQDQICSERDERIAFRHDRYGDWGRQRVLLSHIDELSLFTHKRLESPSWYAAVRLLGLHLLEKDNLDRWLEIFGKAAESDPSKPSLLQLLLLEAVIFAADPAPILVRLWPILIEMDGFWLKQLLRRFLHSATFPHPIAFVLSPKDPVQAATSWRVAFEPYWLPILAFFHQRKDEVVRLAPFLMAQVVNVYFRSGLPNAAYRRETAEFGLSIGRHVLALIRDKNHFGRDEDFQQAFRAALAGAQELPDEVADFALDAAERKERERPYAVATTRRGFGTFTREYPAPWPDGPRSRVNESFVAAVLHENALQALMSARPAEAREVLLATLIQEPMLPSPYGDRSTLERDQLAILRDHSWFPPVPQRGPFLLFLFLNPVEGLEAVLCLVNFAFDRWRELEEKRGRTPPTLELQVEGASRRYVGDERAFTASGDNSAWPDSVVIALMALEQWFYNQLDRNEPVDPAIRTILTRANSVSFLGVLAAVGCKQPSLFKGPLRSLLNVAELLDWDRVRVVHGNFMQLKVGWYGQPHWQKVARAWYSMPHRKTSIFEHATELFVTNRDIRDQLTEAAGRWKQLADSQPGSPLAEILKHLIPVFDVQNWSPAEDEQHRRGFYYQAPETLRQEVEQHQQIAARQGDLLWFPMQCNQMLAGKMALGANDLPGFWEKLQAIAQMPNTDDDPDGIRRVEHSICGGIAVLFTLQRPWLNSNPERLTWCIEQFCKVLERPPAPPPLEFETDISDDDWRSFAARVLPLLWADAPTRPDLRQYMAIFASTSKYKTVSILFETAAWVREQLGSHFVDLQTFLFDWAVVKWEAERGRISLEAMKTWGSAHSAAFAEGNRPGRARPWDALSSLGQRSPTDDPNEPLEVYQLDLKLIESAYAWLPPLSQAKNQAEKEAWISFWKSALAMSLRIANERIDDGVGNEGSPYEWDQWVFERLAALTLQIEEPELRKEFWLPILQLGSKAHRWTTDFLGDWFMATVGRDPLPAGFVDEWKKIIEVARTLPSMTEADRSRFRSEVWIALMGLQHLELWTADHRDVVARLRDEFEWWASRYLSDDASAIAFSRFLSNEAGSVLLPDGLLWLDKANIRIDRSRATQRRVAALATLLSTSWQRSATDIRANATAFDAFRHLLKRLVEIHNQTALALAELMKT